MASHNFTITQESVNRSFTITQDGESRIFTINTGVGPAGESVTVDQTVIDGSTNAVSGNAVFDGLALKAPIANPTFTGTVTAPHIHGSIAGNLYIHVRNDSGGVLTKGTPIYIVGNVGDTDRVRVAAADNTNSAKMPAIGLLEQDLNDNATGNAIIVGELPSANTNAYALNQELYVGVGAITGTKPTTGEVQSVGTVARVQTNTGVIVVNMQGRRTPDGAFAAAVHTHVSADITDATASATPSTIVKRNAQGGAEFAGTSSIAVSVTSTSATAVNAVSTGSTAVYGESGSSDGGFFASDTGTGLVGFTDSGDYHAKFGDTSGDNRSFVARVSGAFGWWRGAFRGFLQAPASITSSDKTWTLPNNTGTVALTTDEMTPTAAGLTSKFGTNKASIVNGDKVTILDSAASDAPKHVLWSLIVSTLTTAFNALYVGLTGDQTVAGNKTLSGQLELTGQAATNTTSAMTRGLMLAEEAFNASFWQFGINSAGGNSGTGSSASRSGSSASGWGRTVITSNAMRSGASGAISLRSDIPLAVSVWGSLDVSSTVSGAVVRIIIGDPGNTVGTAPRFADQNALIARGFGAEVYYSTANSRQEIRLFAHDGTTYSTSSGAAFQNGFAGTHTILVSSDGMGNIKLFAHTTGNSFTNLQRPTLLQTLSGGPSGSSSMGGSHITCVCVNHSTVAPVSSDVLFSIVRSKTVINATI